MFRNIRTRFRKFLTFSRTTSTTRVVQPKSTTNLISNRNFSTNSMNKMTASTETGYPVAQTENLADAVEKMSIDERKTELDKLNTIAKDDLTKEQNKLQKKLTKQVEKDAKEAKKAAQAAEQAANAKKKADALLGPECTLLDFMDHQYGRLLIQSHCKTGRSWNFINQLDASMTDKHVWIRCRVQTSRAQGAKLCFIELRQKMASVQAVVNGKEFAGFAANLRRESVVDVFAKVTKPDEQIKSCSQSEVELAVEKMFCVATADELPFQLTDAARSEEETKALEAAGEKAVDVGLDTRLNNRVLDMRTPANQGIFRIQSGVCQLFREILSKNGFTEIHTPKMIATASEGGADVFELGYFDRKAYLAQSPQLYKQMALMGDLDRVMEIGPVFRSEKSLTHRHLTEFTGCDMEMCFNDHYHEVLDMLSLTFNYIFDGLNSRYKEEIESVRKQHPFEDLKYQHPCLRITYAEGMKLLREQGPAILEERIAKETCPETKKRMLAHIESVKVHPDLEDISTEDEKLLGEVVSREYGQDFYIMDKFPLHIRPFYSMPDPDDPRVANSYDIFIRGEEVMSGAQRIHNSDLLLKMAERCGVDLTPIQPYVDSFKLGANPHAGGGVGLERVVMLFLKLGNIRKSSLFPRDPKRITP